MADTEYMSVKDAIRELQQATMYAQTHVRPSVRLPPVSSPEMSALAVARGGPNSPSRIQRNSTTSSIGFPRPGDTMRSGTEGSRWGFQSGALGGSPKSGLNHTSTYFYDEAPVNPQLCHGNRFSSVGNYSMFGSQASVGELALLIPNSETSHPPFNLAAPPLPRVAPPRLKCCPFHPPRHAALPSIRPDPCRRRNRCGLLLLPSVSEPPPATSCARVVASIRMNVVTRVPSAVTGHSL